jgi:D-amino peptidase
MIEGVQGGFDATFLVGYHGRAGTGDSVLSHTFTATLADVRINGRSFGEIGLNAAVAGTYGSPVFLVTGDESVCAEVNDLLPGTRTVVVKRGLGALAADGLHPERACKLIESAAASAVSEPVSVEPFVVDGAVALEVDVTLPAYADQAMLIPGIRRISGRTLAYDADDYVTAYRVTRLIGALSGLPL